MRCWNCLRETPSKEHFCPGCGQTLRPNPAQATAAKGRLDYLVSESSEWTFLPSEVRRELTSIYRARGERLQQVRDKTGTVVWPESDWASPLWQRLEVVQPTVAPVEIPTLPEERPAIPPGPQPEPAPSEPLGETAQTRTEKLEHISQLVSQAQGPLPELDEPMTPEPPPVLEESLSVKVLAEADIRWFHSLGALLVVAAVVGWLRATWDGYGKNLAGLMILSSPFALHGLAYQMRRSVPLSARLLSILAGLLTAPALLAAEVFDFLPPQVSGRDYWTFAFLVAASLLGWQAQAMKERVPLYVGTLCAVMAGWSQGALLTSVLCLMVAFLLAPAKAGDEADEKERVWVAELRRIGFAAGLFGCFSALFLFRPERSPWTPLLTFTAALIYLHLPTLTRKPDGSSENRVALQAAVTVLGMLLMRWVLDVPASGVGLYALLAAGLFLAARPEDEAGLTALKIGSGLGLLGLAIGFFSQTPILPGESHPDPWQTVMRFVLALAGAGLFGTLSRQTHLENQRQMLGLTAMFSTFGGAYHLFYLLADEPRYAAIIAGFGLWAFLWLTASRWLREYERDLVLAVSAPLLLACSGVAVVMGHEHGLPSPTWARVALWLGAVAFVWERGLLVPRRPDDGQPDQLMGLLKQVLPRLSLWTLALGLVLGGLVTQKDAPLALQILGLVLLLAPASPYRQPGLEMVWLMAPLALGAMWNQAPFPGQLVPAMLAIACGLAAPSALRRPCLGLSSLLGLFVLLGSLQHASGLALATLPLAYALACALPAPGRDWVEAGPAKYGFDALLCAAVFLPLDLAPKSAASLSVTVGVPLIALALGQAGRMKVLERVLTETTAHALLSSAFLWSLFQGAQEAGLLLLLGSVWAFTLKDSKAPRAVTRDLANGMGLLGLCWLSSPSLVEPSLQVLVVGALVSEGLALLTAAWRPTYSNSAILVLLTLQDIRPLNDLETGLTIAASMLALLRGLTRAEAVIAGVGAFSTLKLVDSQLAGIDAELKTRALPLALLLVGIGLWLSTRPEHPSREALKLHPLVCLRTGVALLALPSLLSLAVHADFQDFLWVLAVGCSCLALSAAFSRHEDLRLQLRQLGGWVLTGWAAVSLGRAAMKLPWQLATLVVGLVLLVLGVMVERRRKGHPPEGS